MSKAFRAQNFVIPIVFGYTSVISASYAETASYADFAVSASYALSSSHAEFADDAFFATSASYSETASYAGSASYSVSSSHAEFADEAFFSTSASYSETASYSFNAESASYANSASYAISSSHSEFADDATSASYAETASYIDERLDRYDGGTGDYTTLGIHKYGLVLLSPSASSTTVFLDGTDYENEQYLSVINKTGNELVFSGSNGALIFSEGAVSGSDGKLKNNKSNTTVTALYDGTNWEIIGKLSL